MFHYLSDISAPSDPINFLVIKDTAHVNAVLFDWIVPWVVGSEIDIGQILQVN